MKTKLTYRIQKAILDDSFFEHLNKSMVTSENIQGMKDFIALVFTEDSEQQAIISFLDDIQARKVGR